MPPRQGRIYVLYHASCADGFGAAYAAWKKLGSQAKYIPVSYHEYLPDMRENSEVYILDLSYPRDVLIDLNARMKKVIVLDHHKTAQENLRGLVFAKFDMEKSGAVLAWEYFHPDKEVPILLEYVQDRDLWQWNLLNSQEVNDLIWSYDRTFEEWQKLEEEIHYACGPDFYSVVLRGEAIMKFRKQQTKSIVASAYLTEIDGHKVPVVNTNQNVSEVCHLLLDEFPNSPFSAAFFELEKGTWVVSLRSRGDFDVSEVAKANGGGGHKAASGFHIKGKNVLEDKE